MARRVVNSSGTSSSAAGGSLTSSAINSLAEVNSYANNITSGLDNSPRFAVSQLDANHFTVAALGATASNIGFRSQSVTISNTGTITVSANFNAYNLSGSALSSTSLGEIAPGVIGVYGYHYWNGGYGMSAGYAKWADESNQSVSYTQVSGSYTNAYRIPYNQNPVGMGTFTYNSGTPEMGFEGYGNSPSTYAGYMTLVGTSSGTYADPGSYSSSGGASPAVRHYSDTGTRCGIGWDHRQSTYQWGFYEFHGSSLSNLGYTAQVQNSAQYELSGYCWKDPNGSQDRAFYTGRRTGGVTTNRNGSVIKKSAPTLHPVMYRESGYDQLSPSSSYRSLWPAGLNTYCVNGAFATLNYDLNTEEGTWDVLGYLDKDVFKGINSDSQTDNIYRLAGSNNQYLVQFSQTSVVVYDLAEKLDLSGI